MNSYFDDDVTKTAQPTAAASSTTPPVETKDDSVSSDIDTDLSKLFDNGTSVKKEADATFDAPAETAGGPELTIDKPSEDSDDDLTMDKPIVAPVEADDEKWTANETPKEDKPMKSAGSDWSPKTNTNKKSEESSSSTPKSSGGSLSETETKLKSRKDELSKQISEAQGKMDKVSDMLKKISDLKAQEDELLKSAQNI